MNLTWKTLVTIALGGLCIVAGVKLAPGVELVQTAGAMALIGAGSGLLAWLMKPPSFAAKPEPPANPQEFPPVKP